MVNKKGQFFGLYLVFLTLLMCGVVVALYFVQQGNVLSSLVSPRDVLEVRDGLEVYEVSEKKMIEESLNVAVGSFPDRGFIDSFRGEFLSRVILDEGMTDFVFTGLVVAGQSAEIDARRESFEFLDSILYSDNLIKEESDGFVFGRARIAKRLKLKADDDSKINFPIGFEFEFGGSYLITKVGGKFEVVKQ